MLVADFKAMLLNPKLTERDLNKIQENLYMKLNDAPVWTTGVKKEKNIESFIWWAKGHVDKINAIVFEVNEILKAKAMLPVRGPVPGTKYIEWNAFIALPSYKGIEDAVNFGNPLRKALPYTQDGYVSVDAINNMQRWADWKSSSLSTYERNLSYSINENLHLADLRKLNSGRRADQPALFPIMLIG
jgi:hypothetical protein